MDHEQPPREFKAVPVLTPEQKTYHRARFARLDERSRARGRRFRGRAEAVDLWAVFESAGWSCCFCGEPIDPVLRWLQPPLWVPPLGKRRTHMERSLWREARERYERDRARALANNARVASVDHAIPLWRGGGHVDGNCRPAHYGCNADDGGGWACDAPRRAVIVELTGAQVMDN